MSLATDTGGREVGSRRLARSKYRKEGEEEGRNRTSSPLAVGTGTMLSRCDSASTSVGPATISVVACGGRETQGQTTGVWQRLRRAGRAHAEQ